MIWQYLLIAAEIINVIAIVYILLGIFLENRPVSHLLAWLLVFFFVPVAGFIIFVLIGRNIRKKRIYRKKEKQDKAMLDRLKCLQDNAGIGSSANDPLLGKLMNLLDNNSKSLMTGGNQVRVLTNGSETFPAILEAIEAARHHIHLEYYIFNEGKVGNQLAEILREKARKGVEVRLIYDDFGSWGLRNDFIKELRKTGIECHAFLPVRLHRFASRVNYRNHRKIVIVDGQTGFIGGLNIDDRYLYGDPDLGFWRDTHLQIHGQAVAGLQNIFLNDWHFASDTRLDEQKFFPVVTSPGNALIQIVSSGPDSDWESIMQLFFYLIANAKKSVYISSPYFFPNESILTALVTASLSGTDVRIILPSRSDSKLATWGSFSYFEQLLEAGVDIYLYNNGFTHSKVMIIDDIAASVGTANLDIRSFSQNFEATALLYDKESITKLKNDFENDLQQCNRITYDAFEKRPRHHKIYESTARLFSPLM